jgi:hypothetical protein
MNDFLTANGIQIPTVPEILADLAADQRATIEPTLDTDPDAPLGQLNGIFAERERSLWELGSVAYNVFNPDAAEDFGLDMTCRITGTKRATATASRLLHVNVNLDANTTITAGSIISVADEPTIKFTLDADVTQGPSGGVIEDAGTWTCTELGRTIANAGTVTVIDTPIVGWNSVTTTADAIPGQERDTDPRLRVRREDELAGAGSGTVDAVRAAVLGLQLDDESKPILDALVNENVTDYVDDIGVPGHSIEAVIWDGVDENAPNDKIAQAIWDNKGGGITAYGSDFGTAIDKLGLSQLVAFTRVGILNARITITVGISADDPSTYAGDDAVKAALVAEHDSTNPKGDVSKLGLTKLRNDRYDRAAMGVAGVLEITNLQLGKVGDPFLSNGANLTIPVRTKALLDTSDITVVQTLITP